MTEPTIRSAHLRQALLQRRRELQTDVQGRIRIGRSDRSAGVGDELDQSDADVQGDIELALLQMRAETLARIDEALVRLDAGKYGACFECAGRISAQRLRALPFAVRCQACQVSREKQDGHARQLTQRRGGLSRFSEIAGP